MRKTSNRGQAPKERATLRDRLANHALDEARRLTACAYMLRLIDPEVAKKAAEVFEDEAAAAIWLTETGIFGLGGECPAELTQSAEGQERVLNVLGRIDHGIPP